MTTAEKIGAATLIVTVVGVLIAWFQPASYRAWIGVSISAPKSAVTVTATTVTGTAETTATWTTTYPAPVEPQPQPQSTTNAVPPAGANPHSSLRPEKPKPVTPDVASGARATYVDARRIIEQQWSQAIAFSTAGRWTDAVSAWQRFIYEHAGHNRATDRESFHRLGVAYEALERWPEASMAFERASLEDDQKAIRDLMHLGHCYIQVHRWPSAVNVYKRVLKIEPTNQQAKNSLYWAVKQQLPY
jgi:hypothetical protein